MPATISIDKDLQARLLAMEPRGQKMEQWCWAACSEMVVSYLRSNFSGELPGPPQPTGTGDLHQGAQANWRRSRRGESDGVDCTRVSSADDYKACNETGWPGFFEFEAVAQSTELSSYRFILEELGIPLRENGWPRTIAGRLSSRQLLDLLQHGGPELRRRLAEHEDCALSWEMLRSLIDHELPVVFGWRYPERGGHFMVAAGYVVTPQDERWVVVLDPLPPGHGDWYMVPYDYWVAGPSGRHWRDWWVPRPAAGQPLPPRYSLDHLRVGRELVRSRYPVSKGQPPPATHADGSWLSQGEEAAVLALAEQGLATMRVLASQAPELTAMLGMGGSILRLLLKGFIQVFLESGGKPELGAGIDTQLKAARVDPENLELDEDYIPVFRLGGRDLVDWNGIDPEELLTAPMQVIYRVERSDLAEYRFFSTVTVERYDDGWRLASLGRASLTSALAAGQLFAVLGGVGEQDELSFAGLVRRLAELDLLETVTRLIPAAWLDKLLAQAPEELSAAGESATADRDLERKLIELAGELLGLLKEEYDLRALERLARKADRALGVVEKPLVIEKPEFAVDVGELYQLFIATSGDQLEPVYPSSFYPPDRRVSAGDKASVLRQLKNLAERI